MTGLLLAYQLTITILSPKRKRISISKEEDTLFASLLLLLLLSSAKFPRWSLSSSWDSLIASTKKKKTPLNKASSEVSPENKKKQGHSPFKEKQSQRRSTEDLYYYYSYDIRLGGECS